MKDYSLKYKRDGENRGLLVLEGWVDFENAPEILAEGERLIKGAKDLAAEKSAGVAMTLDVSKVKTVQSVLLSLLLRWLDLLQIHEIDALVTGLSGKMLKMVSITGLDELIPTEG